MRAVPGTQSGALGQVAKAGQATVYLLDQLVSTR